MSGASVVGLGRVVDVVGCAPLASTAADPRGASADADAATCESGVSPTDVSCGRPPQAGEEQICELDVVVGPQTAQSQSDSR